MNWTLRRVGDGDISPKRIRKMWFVGIISDGQRLRVKAIYYGSRRTGMGNQ